MSETFQQIFRRPYAEELQEKVNTGESIADYLKSDIEYDTEGIMESRLIVPESVPVLDPSVEADVDNAIKIYEFLEDLDQTQASDKRLWTYLSHVTFRQYTMQRWPLKLSTEELVADAEARRKAISAVSDRWFLRGTARSLRRHSLARLWWATYVTVAPWEKDPEYFESIEHDDRYIYTRIVFSTQDILQQILERSLGWSDRILIAILEYLRRNPSKRSDVRALAIELNLMLAYRKLSLLSFQELVEVIEETAKQAQEV